MTPDTTDLELALPKSPIEVSFPATPRGLEQDEEWFEFEFRDRRRRLRLHDYAGIYEVPGLYESLVYVALKCSSPERVVRPLEEVLATHDESPEGLRVLDLGAGNGIVGELLRRVGVGELVGIDILPEAAVAAKRDHPEVYDDYFVTDLTQPTPSDERRLREFSPNCLVTVAALGFGDIPPEAFVMAFNLLPVGGWLAMCIKDRFLEESDDSGFGRLVRGMVAAGTIEVLQRERYVHRLSTVGEELFYGVLIARKHHHARLPG